MSLDVAAVEAYTQGRLDRDDEETERQLNAALAAARRFCGWHVTPVYTNATVTLDGPGGPILALPTLKMTGLSEVTEDGIELDVDDLSWSPRGLVVKPYKEFWTEEFAAVTATFSHGFSSEAAADFESVVLATIDRGMFNVDSEAKVIGPFQYFEPAGGADGVFTGIERHVLSSYRLERL